MIPTLRQFVPFLLFAVLVVACDRSVEPPSITHGEPTGIVLHDAHVRVAQADASSSAGGLEIVEGENLHPITILLTDSRGTRFQPAEGGYVVRWEIVDTSVVYATQDPEGRWTFYIANSRSGATTLKLRVYRGEKEMLVLAEIPVRVLPFDRSGGAVIRRGDSLLVTIDADGRVRGAIEVEEGEEFAVRKQSGDSAALRLYFIDSAGVEHRAGENFSGVLHVESEDESIVRGVASYVEHADFRGVAGGTTALRFQLTHNIADLVETGIGGYYTLWKSPPVPIRVKPYSERKVAGFILRRNGSEIARVENGVVTGGLAVREGDVAGDIEVLFIDPVGRVFPPSKEDSRLFPSTET